MLSSHVCPPTTSTASTTADGSSWHTDTFSPAPLQAVFALAAAPSDANSVEVEVNGTSYQPTSHYLLIGNEITWLASNFALEPTDSLVVRYK